MYHLHEQGMLGGWHDYTLIGFSPAPSPLDIFQVLNDKKYKAYRQRWISISDSISGQRTFREKFLSKMSTCVCLFFKWAKKVYLPARRFAWIMFLVNSGLPTNMISYLLAIFPAWLISISFSMLFDYAGLSLFTFWFSLHENQPHLQ